MADLLECLFAVNPEKDNFSYANPTYFDKKCTRVECRGKRRSFEDLFTLANTYFPGTTELELMQTIKDSKLTFIYCNDIHKIVFLRYSADKPEWVSRFKTHAEYNWNYSANTYTAKELLEIFNQTS